MPDLTPASIDQVVQACRDKREAICESLNQCFDIQVRMVVGEVQSLESAAPVPELAGPGVVIAFSVGQSALLCLISAALPIPDWYTDPDTNQISRLGTLAMEWSLNCLPDDMIGENSLSLTVPILNDCISSAEPVDGAVCLPLLAAVGSGEPLERIWLIGPVRRIPGTAEAGPEPSPVPVVRTSKDRGMLPIASRPPALAGRRAPLDRLRQLPVSIIVKLAEKKIELGQILAIGPGAIITFEKSCEELLDLYVNNRLYCRGEAVKIGEKFGIKICEVGSVEQRASAVLAVE
jgi:flagellar motor switch protein FliN/FliY